MCTYWIFLMSTLISTPNVPVCKFKYQSMIIMQNHHLFDHYADQYLFDHCETFICLIIMQILYSCQSYNVVMSIHTKLIFLFVNLKYEEYQRDPHVKCISHYIYHSIVKVLYILGKGKREIR